MEARHLGAIFAERPLLSLPAQLKSCWRPPGLFSRTCLLSAAMVLDDLIVTVMLPLLCLRLTMPQAPHAPPLWAAFFTAVAVGASGVGRLTVYACATRLCDMTVLAGGGPRGRRRRRRATGRASTRAASTRRPRTTPARGGVGGDAPDDHAILIHPHVFTPSRARASARLGIDRADERPRATSP